MTSKNLIHSPRTVVVLLALTVLATVCRAQNTNPSPDVIAARRRPAPRGTWRFTTPEYQKEALKVLISEVNRVAQELKLSEQTPITQSNLAEVFITPPAMGMLGTLSTSNYVYHVRAERKFDGLEQWNLNEHWKRQNEEYSWPVERMDTNAALKTGIQIMTLVGADVAALNRDCSLETKPTMPEGPNAKRFVPDYWVRWKKGGKVVAFIEFLLPTRTIRQMSIWDAKYNLRKPAEVPNLAEILKRGNAPAILLEKMGLESTNAPSQTNTSAVPSSKPTTMP